MAHPATPVTPGSAAAQGPARVVLLLQDLLFGGTQRQALELARGLDPTRFAVEMWMLAPGRDFAARAEACGIPLVWLSRNPAVGLDALRNLWRQLGQTPPDILIPLTAVPNIWGRIFGRLTGIPVVVGTCRGGGAIARQHERFLRRLAHHHVCNSRPLRDILVDRLGQTADRVTVIPNGVDTDHFAPPPEELRPVRDVILCVARLSEDKDHETLLQAFEIAAREHERAELWLVGDGPLAAGVARLIARHPFKGRIRSYPGGADPRPFYQQAKAVVLSSRREGLPNVILEAMSMGVAVAATAVGAIPEVLSGRAGPVSGPVPDAPGASGAPGTNDGWCGLLAPPGDPAALAQTMLTLLRDDALRESLGRTGRARAVADYSLGAMVAAHHTLFERLLCACPGRAGERGSM
ncbi:glycosyltransferase [Desulfolutivibrio sp.]|uniref:glycosyltransferase n=1 Tax=Desulfolutivibrio sp. TaxID=2773296 RepID=UPI002F96A591